MFFFREVEGTGVDYKLALEVGKPKSWLKSVSAFANSHGGHILFGVTDDTHEAVGLKDPQADASRIAELISSRISPAPRYELTTFPSDDNKGLCIRLSVHNGPSYPYYYAVDRAREAYVRHGDRSELASDFELLCGVCSKAGVLFQRTLLPGSFAEPQRCGTCANYH